MNTTTCNTAATVTPCYTVLPQEDAYIVKIDLPGASKDRTTLSLEDNILSVKANRRSERPKSWNPVHRELSDADYSLRLRLSIPVDEARLTAQLADGVLTLTLPLRESAKPRQIPLN